MTGLFYGCSSDGDASPATVSGSPDDAGAALKDGATTPVATDGAASDAAVADAPTVPAVGAPAIVLPVSYTRPDVGTAVSPAELAAATDELIALLKDTRYYDFLDERLHGWPETHPQGGFWWGTFWTGITVTKAGGTVTYKHSNDGSDNAGIHTSPYLEGMCFAHLLGGDAKTAHLVRKMARGYSAWILAMVKDANDKNPRLLSRTFYSAPVTSNDRGQALVIDTSLNRPGIDNAPSDYVHIPNNPTFGDVYVKNKRSKDDIGHMLRAIAQTQACVSRLDAAAKADLAQTKELYEAWAKEVDARNFIIPTLDKDLNLISPTQQLAQYTLAGNVECPSALAIRLMHSGAPGNLDCKNGISSGEALAATTCALVPATCLKNDARQIMRSHQSAAVAIAWQKNQTALGLELLKGLGERVDMDYGFATSASPPPSDKFNPQDVPGFFAYAASVGVPLTSREVRWVHERLHQAYVGMRDPAHAATWNLWAASVPDGTYSFDPPNVGIMHRELGLLIGSCASPYRNPTARPLLDCNRLEQGLKSL